MQNETFFLTRDSRPQPGRATGGFAEPIAVAQVALVRFDQRADAQSLPTSFELAVDAHRSIGHEGNGQDWFQERQIAKTCQVDRIEGQLSFDLRLVPGAALGKFHRALQDGVVVRRAEERHLECYVRNARLREGAAKFRVERHGTGDIELTRYIVSKKRHRTGQHRHIERIELHL